MLVDRIIKKLFCIGHFAVSTRRALSSLYFASLVFLVPLTVSDTTSADTSVTFQINNNLYYAVLTENRELLARIDTRGHPLHARHYRGVLEGYPDSAVRFTLVGDAWFGIVVLDGEIFRLARQAQESGLITDRVKSLEALSLAVSAENQLCGMESLTHDPAAFSHSMTTSAATMPQAAGLNPPCSNPVNGLCLFPHIEFAYDLSYQAMPNFGMTVLDRAVSEINEMELFFERGLGYRFSQVSLTMLDSVQDSYAGSASALTLKSFVGDLKQKRENGDFAYLASSHSIFHFVTGRNFPPDDGSNIVGIAYPKAVCNQWGRAVGVTDAGDVGNVVDPAKSLVSLIMAHEIGHNLGAGHDNENDNSCPSGQFVMTASIGANGSSISDFSSCSIAEIQQRVNLYGSASCFDYPVDIEISDDCDNPSEPVRGEPFTAAFAIATQRRAAAGVATLIGIQGVIADPAHGEFISVTTGSGESCTVAANGLSYQCSLMNPGVEFELRVETRIDELAVEFSAQHSVFSESGSLIDVDDSNDTLEQFYNTFSTSGSVISGSCPDTSTSTQQPASSSNANNILSSGGGGGGGSVGVGPILLLLGHLLWRHRRRSIG